MSTTAVALVALIALEQCLVDGASSTQNDYPCSPQEFECLTLGRLLNPADGQCYIVGSSLLCGSGFFVADRTRARSRGLHGACAPPPCPQGFVLAAATGTCQTFDDFENKTCGGVSQWGVRPFTVFGEEVCLPKTMQNTDLPPSTQPLQQTKTGRCVPPNWMVPAPQPLYNNVLAGSTLLCSQQESQCYGTGQVFVADSCHYIREQGPCASGEWLLLDKDALPVNEYGLVLTDKARIAPVCKPRPCPEGQYLPVPGSAAGDACLRPSDLRRLLCAGYTLALDVFGRMGCSTIPERYPVRWHELPCNGTERCLCPVDSFQYAAVAQVASVRCAMKDDGTCVTEIQEARSQPRFVLQSEDH